MLAGATFLLLTLVKTGDVIATLYFDPSLSHEGNVFVVFLRGKVPTLLYSTSLSWFVCSTFLLLFWRGETLRTSAHSKRFRTFVQDWACAVIASRRSMRSTLPGGAHWNEGLQAIRLFGVALSWALITQGLLATYAWFATNGGRGPSFFAVNSAFKIGRWSFLISLITLSGFVIGSLLFFWSEFKERVNKIGRCQKTEH